MTRQLDISEVRRLLHDLREPLGAFFIHVGLLEDTQLTAEGQSYLKAMHAHMQKARAALDEIDFVLERGDDSSRGRATKP